MSIVTMELPDGRRVTVEVPTAAPPSNIPAQAASGASQGLLSTLDILPKGLVAGAEMAGFKPEWQGTPFQNLGAMLGLGQRVPQTPGEEKAQFAGQMLGASVLPAAGAVGRAQTPLRALGTELASLTGATGGGLTGEAIGGETGQLVGTLAGGMAPAAAPFASRLAISPTQQQNIPARVAAAQRQGIPISAGQASGGSALEKASAVLPGGQRIASQFAERQAGQMGQRVDELTSGLTAREPSQEAAGRAITEGLDAWTANFKQRAGTLYDELENIIPSDTPVALDRTKSRLDDLIADPELSAILDAPLVRQLNKLLAERADVPYEVAAAVRSRIGQKLASPELVADASKGQLKALYGSMSDDLDDVAKAIGPEAERLSQRASSFWRSGMKRIDDFLDPIQKRGVPEDVYKAAVSGMKEGPSRINALKKSLEPEQWNAVVATTLRRLGRAVPSARTTGEIAEEATDFSMETFLTNLERMDAGARKALFTGSRYAGLESGLNDLVDIAQGVRGQRQAVYNPSGTAAGVYNAAGLAAPAIASMVDPALALKLALGIGGNMGLQKALQSPAMVNWLANPTAFQPSMAGQLTRGRAAFGAD